MSDHPRKPHKSTEDSKDRKMPTKYNRVRVEDLLNADPAPPTRSPRRLGSAPRGKPSSSLLPPDHHINIDIPCDHLHCKKTFNTRSALHAHQRRSHPAPTAFICESCRSSFSTPPNLNKHVSCKPSSLAFSQPISLHLI